MPIDYSEYPQNWLTEIRPAVLKRANDLCEDCGAPNHKFIYRPISGSSAWELWPEADEDAAPLVRERYRPVKIILTIAHLDHDKTNHDVSLDRLKALCQRCHLNYDRSRHIENRKYGRNWRASQTKLDL